MTRRGVLGAMIAGAGALAGAVPLRRDGGGGAGTDRGRSADLLYSGARIFDGGRFLDAPMDLLVRDGRLEALAPELTVPDDIERRAGGFLFPGFVDAHVHLSFSDPRAVVRGGVTAVLDLGEPFSYAFTSHPPVRFRAAGPLITAPGGYPTASWGANGYALEISDPASAREAVATLADRGAAIIKIAIEPAEGPLLDAGTMRAIVEAAHARGLRAAAHALSVEAVRAAITAGADVLAHTPVEPLPPELVRQLADRGVVLVSTVRAFGARRATRNNLVALANAGCPVAYGTDLGNGSIRPGLDIEELAIIEEAVGDRALALASATSVAGSLAGAGGRIAPGLPADLVWVPRFTELADLRRRADVRVGA